MKAAVCGGRDLTDRLFVWHVLTEIYDAHSEINEIVHGAARGVDATAHQWANAHAIKVTPVPAKWDLYKKSAGYRRNHEILNAHRPDILIAFPGGRGTMHMVKHAIKAFIPLIVVYPDGKWGLKADTRLIEKQQRWW